MKVASLFVLVGVADARDLVARERPLAPTSTTYQTRTFLQKLTHFSFGTQAATKWEQRYLFDDTHWAKGSGPILFYTGNEGPITAFWAASGFVTTTLAAKFKALVIFAECRYYGTSLPFKNASFLPENLQWLTTEEVLADYARLLTHVKKQLGAERLPVIAFGGSYGGTLSTLFRLKYPHVVAGALAASAPIGYYAPTSRFDGAPEDAPRWDQTTWFDTVVRDYTDAVPGCYTTLVAAVHLTNATLQSGGSGAAAVSKAFSLCAPPADHDQFLYWITEALESIPQVDYPYAVGSMPASPVNSTCHHVNGKSGAALLEALGQVMAFYYDLTSQPSGCFADAASEQVGGGVPGDGPSAASSWGFQSCTETMHNFSIPPGSWRTYTFDKRELDALCARYYAGVTADLGRLEIYGGGYRLARPWPESSLTNIIWSNGKRDPWHGGGFLRASDARPGGLIIVMNETAHHQDLRLPHPADPHELVVARQMEATVIGKWIAEHKLPSMRTRRSGA